MIRFAVDTPSPAPGANVPPRKTTMLLDVWHGGGDDALHALLERHLPFLRDHVCRHAAPAILNKFDVDDFVQETARQILLYAPPFQVRDGQHFRALLARMVMSSISEKWKYITAMRRDMNREAQVPRDSVLQLDPAAPDIARPSQLVAQQEEEAWVRLGLELATDEDRVVILMRDWEDKSFPDIAEELGLEVDAARMRYNRAIKRLGKVLKSLRAGDIPDPD